MEKPSIAIQYRRAEGEIGYRWRIPFPTAIEVEGILVLSLPFFITSARCPLSIVQLRESYCPDVLSELLLSALDFVSMEAPKGKLLEMGVRSL
ncbi:hypothetical protein LIER_29843 [Lithospermum erythrorhizon]|uniref:Uncharacterized protein n=1 Tax=Lithospermum erythrorhizon TaxID=34254 RepID=A0AAV3RRF9_LITER